MMSIRNLAFRGKRAMGPDAGEKSKSFAAYTPGEARTAAAEWLRNFKDHGPLNISSIRVTEERELFVATVAYSEMTIESSPQYFRNYPASAKPA
jgi:hypothetical protein